MTARPWIEGAALLSAHDRAAPAPKPRNRRSYPVPPEVRFALLRADPQAKPLAFPDIDALARHIQRERGSQGIEMVDVQDLLFDGDTDMREGVSVYALDMGGDRDRLIGHCWLDGRTQDALRAAIRANQTGRPGERRAA
ncbi:hypothetical protein [Brevundimonas faecalis]|uniref:Uncharacterized protein n=1 Tax=Brevundimonas faecalis TaxID=947378 RepID=A0ABV2RAV6_9CAUL